MSSDDRSCQCGCGCDGSCQGSCVCAGACEQAVALGAPDPRPGLQALAVRIGDYGRFLAAATQALSAPAAVVSTNTPDPSDPVVSEKTPDPSDPPPSTVAPALHGPGMPTPPTSPAASAPPVPGRPDPSDPPAPVAAALQAPGTPDPSAPPSSTAAPALSGPPSLTAAPAPSAVGTTNPSDAAPAFAVPPLQALGTRDSADPIMAMIDAWAVAADVLTFYRERLTNEGYLRCARDERSLRWLAGEVGYKPRPGVSASAWLAYTLDANAAPVQIPAGAKVQTSPNGDEQMQIFETLEALDARYEWSAMSPRKTRMPAIDLADALSRASVKLAGTSTTARPGERLIFVFGYELAQQVVREVADAKVDVLNGWVDVSLVPRASVQQAEDLYAASKGLISVPAAERILGNQQLFVLTSFFLGGAVSDALALSLALAESAKATKTVKKWIGKCVDALQAISAPAPPSRVLAKGADIDSALERVATAASAQLSSAEQLNQSTLAGLATSGAKRGALLKQASPRIDDRLYQAWRSLPAHDVTPETTPEVFILRAVTSPFGAAAPKKEFTHQTEWEIQPPDIQPGAAFLDNVFGNISPGSLALVDVPLTAVPASAIPVEKPMTLATKTESVARLTRLARIASTQVVGRSDYATNSRVTRLDVVDPENGKRPFQVIDGQKDITSLRQTVYAVQSEALTLAPEPIDDRDVGGSFIELDTLLDGIEVGRWIIVYGERTDIIVNGQPLPGIVDGELALVAGIDQRSYQDVVAGTDPPSYRDSPGDTLHTVLLLATSLAYTYRLDTVKVYANVVKASHGESGSETLGSGNAAARLQRFALRRAPLTFVPAVTTSGVQGTQQVRVNNVQWQEVDSLLDAGATERVFEMSTDGAGVASFTFGDGIRGARLPTGQANVRAVYRAGLGAVGNARAGQIIQLATRPLGVNSVVNPLAASGGADRDGSEHIRANVPLATLSLSSLSRLVSVADYGYFARRYAGVGQAAATKLADGAFECVHVTLAGVDDAPLRADDDLVSSLHAAYVEFGDPALPVVIDVRERVALFIQARVSTDPLYDWDTVKLAIQGRLYNSFSFDRRKLGQSAYLSEVIAAIQSVKGVDWVDVDILGGISELEMRDKAALDKAVAGMQQQISPGPVQSVVRVRAAMTVADASADELALTGATQFLPAQLAYLLRDVPGTLVLNRA